MSVVDLRHRLTQDRTEFLHWDTTLGKTRVLVEGEAKIDGSQSLDLSVSEAWIDTRDGVTYEVPERGLAIPPRTSVVIVVAQFIALPFDMLGIVTGRGSFIFTGVLVSPGKIDPRYSGHLRIAVFNSSKRALSIRRGDRICSVCFFQLDTEFVESLPIELNAVPRVKPIPLYKRAWTWMSVHYESIRLIAVILAVVTGLIALLAKCGPSR